MATADILKPLLERIRDPRYLFVLALLLVVGGLSYFAANQALAIIVVVGGFGLVTLTTLVESRGDRIRAAYVVHFPDGTDASLIELDQGEYTIRREHEEDGDSPRTQRVNLLREGMGWVCPAPSKTRSGDVVTLRLYERADEERCWKGGPFAGGAVLADLRVRAERKDAAG